MTIMGRDAVLLPPGPGTQGAQPIALTMAQRRLTGSAAPSDPAGHMHVLLHRVIRQHCSAPGVSSSPSLQSDAALTAFCTWSIHVHMAAVCSFGCPAGLPADLHVLGDSRTSCFSAAQKGHPADSAIYVLPGLLENKVFAVFLAEPIVRYHRSVPRLCCSSFPSEA